MKNKYYIYRWVCKVISSCETIEQLHSARNLVYNFNVMFDDERYHKMLQDKLHLKNTKLCL